MRSAAAACSLFALCCALALLARASAQPTPFTPGQFVLIDKIPASTPLEYKAVVNLAELDGLFLTAQSFQLGKAFEVNLQVEKADGKRVDYSTLPVLVTQNNGPKMIYVENLKKFLVRSTFCGVSNAPCTLIVIVASELGAIEKNAGVIQLVPQQKDKTGKRLSAAVGPFPISNAKTGLKSSAVAYTNTLVVLPNPYAIVAFNFIVTISQSATESYVFVRQPKSDGSYFKITDLPQNVPCDASKPLECTWSWKDLTEAEQTSFRTLKDSMPLGNVKQLPACAQTSCQHSVTVFTNLNTESTSQTSIYVQIVDRADIKTLTASKMDVPVPISVTLSPVLNDVSAFYEIAVPTATSGSFAQLAAFFTDSTHQSEHTQYIVVRRTVSGTKTEITNLGLSTGDQLALLDPHKSTYDIFYLGKTLVDTTTSLTLYSAPSSSIQLKAALSDVTFKFDAAENQFRLYQVQTNLTDTVTFTFTAGLTQTLYNAVNVQLGMCLAGQECKFPTEAKRRFEFKLSELPSNTYTIRTADEGCNQGCSWMVRLFLDPSYEWSTSTGHLLKVKVAYTEVHDNKVQVATLPIKDQNMHNIVKFDTGKSTYEQLFYLDFRDAEFIALNAQDFYRHGLAVSIAYEEQGGQFTTIGSPEVINQDGFAAARQLFPQINLAKEILNSVTCNQTMACNVKVSVKRNLVQDPNLNLPSSFGLQMVVERKQKSGQKLNVEHYFGPMVLTKEANKSYSQAFAIDSHNSSQVIQAYQFVYTVPASSKNNFVIVREFGGSDTLFQIKATRYPCKYGEEGCKNLGKIDLTKPEIENFQDSGKARRIGNVNMLTNCEANLTYFCTYAITVFLKPGHALPGKTNSFFIEPFQLKDAVALKGNGSHPVALNISHNQIFQFYKINLVEHSSGDFAQVGVFYDRLPTDPAIVKEEASYFVFVHDNKTDTLVSRGLHTNDELAMQRPYNQDYYLVFLGSGDLPNNATISIQQKPLDFNDLETRRNRPAVFQAATAENVYFRYVLPSTRTNTVTIDVLNMKPGTNSSFILQVGFCKGTNYHCQYPSYAQYDKQLDLGQGGTQLVVAKDPKKCGGKCVLLIKLGTKHYAWPEGQTSLTANLLVYPDIDSGKDGSSLPSWAIILIIIGSLVIGGLIFFFAFRYYRRQKLGVLQSEYNQNIGNDDSNSAYSNLNEDEEGYGSQAGYKKNKQVSHLNEGESLQE